MISGSEVESVIEVSVAAVYEGPWTGRDARTSRIPRMKNAAISEPPDKAANREDRQGCDHGEGGSVSL